MHPLHTVHVPPERLAIHWFGQSSFGFKGADGKVLLVDPYFPHHRPTEKYIHGIPPLDETQLPVDYVLLTHDHSDHTDVETLRRIVRSWPEIRLVGPSESVARLLRKGFPATQLTAIAAGQSVMLGPIQVHAVWAKPAAGIPEEAIAPPNVTHLGFIIAMRDIRVYISGDPVHTFARHPALWQPVADLKPDIAVLTTHPTEGEFPFFDGSAAMARQIGVRYAIPAHYQCFTQRNYDAQFWAAHFSASDPEPLIIPYNRLMLVPPG